MSVTSVELLWTQRGGRDGIDRRQSFTRLYEVLTDDKNDDENIAAGEQARDMGLPGNGDLLADWTTAAVTDLRAEQGDSPTIWYVTVTYETELPDDLAAESLDFDPTTGEPVVTPTAPDGTSPPTQQRDPNPLNWTAKWKFGFEAAQEPVRWDKNGSPIANSAFDEFSPAPTIEQTYSIITIEKNYAPHRFSMEWLKTFQGSVNNAPWHTHPARTCRMTFEVEPTSENGIPFFRALFRIKVKPESWIGLNFANDTGQGWDLRLADVGYQTGIDTGGGVIVKTPITPPTDERGNEKPGPYPLDGTGQFAQDGIGTRFKTFRVYKEKAWSLLGL